MNRVKALQDHGQSVWLDFLSRSFVADGGLQKLVEDDGVQGVTSNPSIFEKAIGHSADYDESIRRALHARDRSVAELYECLAVEDIKHAADILRPVFEARHGADGFVSIEVSPYLAVDTRRSIDEAGRLWHEVDRKNLMVKIPATPEGLPAIRALTAEGINVNITLLFSQQVYDQVAEAYLSGLEAFAGNGRDLSRIASVASFFVSRIDTAADKLLDERIAKANDPDEKARLSTLKGKVAIANAKLAYQRYKRLFAGERWSRLRAKGARPQRLLWASTGTKNKAYRDVLYVEELIGRDTVNTMPPATLDAFREHGRVRDTLEQDIEDAERVLRDLDRAGISLDAVTTQLVEEGVHLFADASDKLLAAVAGKRAAFLRERLNSQELSLTAELQSRVRELAEAWRADGKLRQLYERDKSLWTGANEDKWLGWLNCVDEGLRRLRDYQEFAKEVKAAGFTDALLLGMGGSSLGPEVLAQSFALQSGWPRLRILDSTDPAQIRAAEASIDVGKTLFIVSSKSGSTTEPNMLKEYFFSRVQAAGNAQAGRQFIAITDPGSSLEGMAKRDGFWRIFHGVPSIGGRYSVLSPFGLVPAAVAGIDLGGLLDAARTMVLSCGPDVPPSANPAAQLGIALGVAASQGRDKVTILASPRIADFGAWAEQLIAESTGKEGKGLIPVDGEPLGEPGVYGSDRFFIDLRLAGEDAPAHEAALARIEQAGHPVARVVLGSIEQIGQEFFRFELVIAVAGALLRINPFDQPDVEASKVKTRELTKAFETTGALPRQDPVCAGERMEVYADNRYAAMLRSSGADGSVEQWLKAHFARVRPGDYVGFLAYMARTAAATDALARLRLAVRDRQHVATCVGFGPRFLHSTGQAYKGGPNSGAFLQITADVAKDLAVPGHAATFGVIEAAQARGDFEVLAERGRRAVRVHLKGDIESGLSALAEMVNRALA